MSLHFHYERFDHGVQVWFVWFSFKFVSWIIVSIALLKRVSCLFQRNLCLTLRPGCTPQELLLLWKHECDWVYGHRLIDSVDRERFQQAFLTAKKRFADDEQVASIFIILLVMRQLSPVKASLVFTVGYFLIRFRLRASLYSFQGFLSD